MLVEWRPITDRNVLYKQWRHGNVGASEVPAVYGMHPFKSRLRLWAEKRGVHFDNDDNPVMHRGRLLEPAVAEGVAEQRPQWKVRHATTYLVDAKRRIGATPDYWIDDDVRGLGVLECKTARRSIWDREWSAGEECADYALLQCFVTMSMAGVSHGAVAVFLDEPFACDLRVFDIEPFAPSWDAIQSDVAAFWDDVATGREPPADYAADRATIRALRSASRSTAGKSVDLSGNAEAIAALERRGMLKQEIKEAEAECDAIDDGLVGLLGDAEKATGLPGWSVTFKSGMRSAYSVPEKQMRTLRIKRTNGAAHAD